MWEFAGDAPLQTALVFKYVRAENQDQTHGLIKLTRENLLRGGDLHRDFGCDFAAKLRLRS
jgi:hypothetical protein